MFHNLDRATLHGCQSSAYSNLAKFHIHVSVISWSFVYFRIQVKDFSSPLNCTPNFNNVVTEKAKSKKPEFFRSMGYQIFQGMGLCSRTESSAINVVLMSYIPHTGSVLIKCNECLYQLARFPLSFPFLWPACSFSTLYSPSTIVVRWRLLGSIFNEQP